MKTLLIIPLILFFGFKSFACGGYVDFTPRWTIGIIGAGHYRTMNVEGHAYFLPGVQVKRTMGKYQARVGIEHTKYYTEPADVPGGADILYVEGPSRRTLVRVGVERGWTLHRFFAPYAAIDLAGQFGTSDLTYSGGIAGMHERHEIVKKGVGVLPAVGVKVNLSSKISFFAEYRAEFFLNDVYSKTTYYWGNVDSRPSRETNGEFDFGDIGHVGIQIAF
ncbi:MAG TPA: hypothetical protein VK826_16810 [Bacteroidia bacterium]|nr:hypothetical protein [Bacteroidia bacterium]